MATKYATMFVSATNAAGLTLALLDDYGNEVNAWNHLTDRFKKADAATGYVRVWCDDLPEDINMLLKVTKTSDASVIYTEYITQPTATLSSEQRFELAGYLSGYPVIGEREVLVEPAVTQYPSFPWAVNGCGPNNSGMLFYRDWDQISGTGAAHANNGAYWLVTGLTPTYPGVKIFDKTNGSNGTNSQIQNFVAVRDPASGRVVALWCYYNNAEPTSQRTIMRSFSADQGSSWSAAVPCTIPNDFTTLPRAPSWAGTFAGDNAIYMLVYGYLLNSGNNGSAGALWKSTDNGATWTHVSWVNTLSGSAGFEEPYLCQMPNTGRLIVAAGSESTTLGMGTAYSDDHGLTWKNAAGVTVTEPQHNVGYDLANVALMPLSASRVAVFGRLRTGPTFPHTRWGVGYCIIDDTGTPVTKPNLFEPAGYQFDCAYPTFLTQPYDPYFQVVFYTDMFRYGIDFAAFGRPALAQRRFYWVPPAAGTGLTAQDVANAVVTAMAGAPVGSVGGAVGSVAGNVGGNVVGSVVGNVVGSVGSLAAPERDAIAAALLASVLEGTVTVEEALRAALAHAVGDIVKSGSNLKLKSLDGTQDRATAILNTATGERAVTGRDLS